MPAAAMIKQLVPGDHVCVPVHGTTEQHALASVFTDSGLRAGHKVVILADRPVELRHRLATGVPDARQALAADQLQVLSSRKGYLPDGTLLDADGLLDGVLNIISTAQREGYETVRICGDLSRIPADRLDGDTLVEYETRVNERWPGLRAIAMCHYNPIALGAELWDRLVSVHPSTHTFSPGPGPQLRCRSTPRGLQVTGEVDLVNRNAFHSLLEYLRNTAGPCEIDATGLRFIDAHSVGYLIGLAASRGRQPTTIRCAAPLATLLDLLGSSAVASLTVAVADASDATVSHLRCTR